MDLLTRSSTCRLHLEARPFVADASAPCAFHGTPSLQHTHYSILGMLSIVYLPFRDIIVSGVGDISPGISRRTQGLGTALWAC